MKDVERYLQAGTRENTRRSYQSAIEHFEVTWGGFLPATSDAIVRYLVDYADTLSLNTLKQRLAALAQWHVSQGFPDPTKTPTVRQVLKGIRTLHPNQAKPSRPRRCSCSIWSRRFNGWSKRRHARIRPKTWQAICAADGMLRCC
ncbi:hypothetical protein [Pseudomonas nitroreducens]|uniref:hypothetical protein n=1 Tax=Pseudomonas nitroreducens TaxID=46680 RepID=UPI0018C9B5DB|nr:hypothetical protein [Pseudomonas nitroreducens]